MDYEQIHRMIQAGVDNAIFGMKIRAEIDREGDLCISIFDRDGDQISQCYVDKHDLAAAVNHSNRMGD